MFALKKFAIVFLLILLPGSAAAEQAVHRPVTEFPWPSGFEGRVAFWRDVFTKYGKNHRVFHHREHPAIVYSVLDFSELVEDSSGKKLVRLQELAIKEEIDRIQRMLKRLADGNAPANQLEKRLEALFKNYTGGSRSDYIAAMDQKLIRFQTGVRERFIQGLIRSGRYLYAIERIFAAEGLPPGLARLPLVESSFDYEAYSSVGAAGIWQFTRSTGKRYMQVSSAIDERRDPIISTRAAAKYLRNSYNRVGTWPLAVTSYNHGLQGIINAANSAGSRDLATIVKRYKGGAFGFASSNFYAEFLAALEVERNSQIYFPGLKREGPWYFDEIRLARATRFADLARWTGSSHSELEQLNLGFKSPIIRGGSSIPAGSVVKVPPGFGKAVLASSAGSTLVWLGPTVKIAQAAPAAGQLESADQGAAAAVLQTARVEQTPREEIIEPPVSVSDVEQVKLKELVPAEESAANQKSYRVQQGDTLRSISRKHNVSVGELITLNGISDPKKVRAGMVLQIPGKGSKSAEPKPVPPRLAEYTIKSGDTLGSVAAQSGVSLQALLKANPGLDPRRIKPGLKIKLPSSPPNFGDTPVRTQESEVREAARNQDASKSRPGNKPGKNLEPVSVPGSKKESYLVQPGDSIEKIAKKLGLPRRRLEELNPGVGAKIFPGQELVVR